jgi:hypothetical protein
LAFVIIFVLPLAFPASDGGTFYSPSLVQAAVADFIDLYIPSNPFSSLARTVIPAAAVFSVFLGVALIGVQHKTGLLDVFSAISDTLTSMAKIVVKLTPIGVFAISAEAGSAWTILYPRYAVAIPEPHITKPVALAMAQGDQQFLDFINAWLALKKTKGSIDQLYDKWILGKVDTQKAPRWSVIRNVLHWVD